MDSLIIPNYAPPHLIGQLRKRATELLDEFDVTSHPLTQFRTDTDTHVGDDYFLTSGDKIRYFLEPGTTENAGLVVPKEQAVNKIGHALHELDPVFKDATFAWSIKEIAHKLHFQDPRVLQSMLIFKQPKIGGPVPPHQDTTFLYTEPHSAVGYWLALEDCTRENGCLAFIPGSHKTTPVTRRFVRRKDGQGTEFTGYDNLVDCKEEDFVWETCPAGSLVLIHGAVVHRSLANTSPHSRWAYAFHVIEGNAEYSADNWHVTFITH